MLAIAVHAAWPLAAHSLTLKQYVADAVQSNPLVREQLHVYRQEVQDLEIALSGWRPRLDLQGFAGRFSREAPNTLQRRKNFDSYDADLTLTQNLFSGFETTYQVEQAKSRLSSAAYRLFDTADNVALEAVKAFPDVLEEQRLVALAKENVESHERILSQIRERNVSGIGFRSDVEQTESRLARAHASLIAQQNNLQDALTQLHRLLGRYVEPSLLEEPAPPRRLPDSLQELLEQALDEHPAVISATRNVEAARYDYRRSRSSNYPSVDLQLQQSLGRNDSGIDGDIDERGVMLNFRYNLYRGGADLAEQRKRISVLHENEAFLARVRREVIDALRLAWAADASIREQVPYLRTHVEKARQTLETYREEFFLNLRDLLDLLDAESELNIARNRLTQALYAGVAARFRIYEALGALFRSLGLDANLTDDDLRFEGLRARGLDAPELVTDRDRDNLADTRDQCDNSRPGNDVDAYGCRSGPAFDLGYPGSGRPPEPGDDSIAVEAGQAQTIPAAVLLGNDSDPQGDVLTLIGVSQPSHGSVTIDPDGDVAYTPEPGFVGDDAFTYIVGNARSQSAVGNVRLQVRDRSGAPSADVERLRFGYKKETLTQASLARLDALVERVERNPNASVEVYTYTDNVGSSAYNRRLAERRARTIKRLLVERGVSAGRVSAFGMGEVNPVADNATEEGRARNRRAEIRIIPSTAQ